MLDILVYPVLINEGSLGGW